jgi:CRP-like cAMP-binding protein
MPVAPDLLRGNRLLAAVSEPVREQLATIATHQRLAFRQTLFEPDTRIEHVVFPVFGVCSLLSIAADGRSIEVATIGNEGFVGLPVFLQATLMSAHRAIAQIPGEAIVFGATDFLDVSNSGGRLQAVLMRYTQALMTQIAQGAACNRLHTVEQRCARWLLMTHDRVERDRFELTQEFLGLMLGTGRQAVNEVERAFQAAELIEYSRGWITVLDRAGLEDAACECYATVRAEFERLLAENQAA